ncbi:hypothetical protein ONS95_006545 [Cadophora gregata]|uniref:uncharacterized protein n=1 Tax=Cadophora gregata TaxID=51156 RepID=UPI0026DDC86D|nr:uncharacterized protein ONS95_006545 [Cadophora gregata]KAK0101370.1 hypothetical protein ONS95_006545 [Cadophora gregata]
MPAPGLSPLNTPPALTRAAMKQVPATPISIRGSTRGIKPTEKVAQLSTLKEDQKALITPDPSPPQVLVGKKLLAKKNAIESVQDGKSDQVSKAASSPSKVMLRFAPNVVQSWKSRVDSTSSPSPSPPSSGQDSIVTTAKVPKNGSKAISTIELKSTTTGSKPVKTAPMSASDSESTSLSDSILPSIEKILEYDIEEELEVPVATPNKASTRSAKKPVYKPAPKKAPKKAINKNETKIDTPLQERSVSSQTSLNNEVAKDVANSAATSRKRGFAKSNSESTNEKATTNGRTSKVQKVSPLGRRQTIVSPEPIVDTDPPGFDETELTAWLFAYGKEGSEDYLRAKFPRCSLEAYGYGKLQDYKFILHSDGYAKAIQENGSEIYGAIWKIPEKVHATLEKKAGKHGMKYIQVPNIQPMRRHPDYEPNCWNAPWVPHAEPIKCWMGVCEKLDDSEENGKEIIENDFFKRRGLSRVVMEMEMAGVPAEYVQKYIRSWVPPPRTPYDTGYFVNRQRIKPVKKK